MGIGPLYYASDIQPVNLMNLDQDLPMGVFNHDSNLLSMDADDLDLDELSDNELDMLETLLDGDTADFMQALELLELRENIMAADELENLSRFTDLGKFELKLIIIVE